MYTGELVAALGAAPASADSVDGSTEKYCNEEGTCLEFTTSSSNTSGNDGGM